MAIAPSADFAMVTTVAQLSALLLALSLLPVAVVIARVVTYIVVSTADVRYLGCCNMHQYPFNFINQLKLKKYEYKVFYIAPHGHDDLDVERTWEDPQLFLSAD